MESREDAFTEKKELIMTVLPEFKKLFDSDIIISSITCFYFWLPEWNDNSLYL